MTSSYADDFLSTISSFPKPVVVALACGVRYLRSFGVAHSLLEVQYFTPFATRTHMLLASNTLAHLEIFANSTDGTPRGSLIWLLDKTQTRFGARLLKSWVGRPLVDRTALQDRVGAIEELREGMSAKATMLRNLLKGLPDLAKGLARIQYGKVVFISCSWH
jgi:DNA mismatch repair protein MSH3